MNEQKGHDNLQSLESTLSKGEQFVEKNQKKLTIAVLAILAVVGLYIAYQRFYKNPREEKALSQMFVAEQYFGLDSFKLAVNGDGNYPGFLDVIKDYGSTKAGNLAKYYLGVSYVKLKDYDKAIKYLEDFSSSDKMLAPIALGNLGDAYAEKGDMQKAVKYYEEAASKSKNEFTSPVYLMKAGRVYENQKNWTKALETYELVQTNYKKTTEGRVIEKFITRVKLSM